LKKQVFCGVFALALAVTGCGVQKKEAASDIVPENRQELTILHVDAGTEGFDSFISQAEKDLGIEIHIEKCPANADNRQAKIATLLTSGDDSVDLITVNDEMISEFKHKGFLLPLEDTVMTEETAANFLQEYLKEICMSDGHIFSVPFRMDIMAFWVNQELLDQAGLDRLSCLSDLEILQKKLQNTGKYAYGDAWEISYIYNSISEYVDFFGGDYTDWTDPKTREAAEYMKRMLDTGMISEENLIDQHELNEKFINGQYGCMFMYTGVLSTFQNAGVYGKDKIHMAPFPEFDEKVTNIATWQYVLNKVKLAKRDTKGVKPRV
jgi:multiple sugar transport system substrate-binding protein